MMKLTLTVLGAVLLCDSSHAFSVTQQLINRQNPQTVHHVSHRTARHTDPLLFRITSKSDENLGNISISKQLRSLIRKFVKLSLPVFLLTRGHPAFAAATSNSLPATLGKTQLLLASLFVTTTGGLALWSRGLPDMARQVLWSCARCSIQLYILGGVLLHRLLGATQPGIVGLWIVGVGFVAAQQALSRLEYTYDNLPSHLLISILFSVIFVLGIAISGNLLGNLVPWFSPRTLIPVSGMLFGSAISASSLAAKALTREFVQGKATLELRLARGASAQEAVRPLLKLCLSDALTPTINTLTVTGIVHMPGMMTGQILAGQSPQQAAAYQTLILFLIASTACISVQLLTDLVTRSLVDFSAVRLEVDRLKRKEDMKSATSGRLAAAMRIGIGKWFGISMTTKESTTTGQTFAKPILKKLGNTSVESTPMMSVDSLQVERAGQQVSLTVGAGDRIGITGPSGSGKTQILRSLAGLEAVEPESSLRLEDGTPKDLSWPEWRRRVCWVSQDRSTVEGTPSMLFEELVTYRSRSKLSHSVKKPQEIAKRWNLHSETFDRSWATLSGGEAQRASLAIALALQPQVLLLDEATSGLDAATQALVEETLANSKIPIVMVTHSKEQLDRFCTHHLELGAIAVPTISFERVTG